MSMVPFNALCLPQPRVAGCFPHEELLEDEMQPNADEQNVRVCRANALSLEEADDLASALHLLQKPHVMPVCTSNQARNTRAYRTDALSLEEADDLASALHLLQQSQLTQLCTLNGAQSLWMRLDALLQGGLFERR